MDLSQGNDRGISYAICYEAILLLVPNLHSIGTRFALLVIRLGAKFYDVLQKDEGGYI